MSSRNPQSLMLVIFDLVREINLLGLRVTQDGEDVFERISLQLRSFTPSELGFLRIVSWLYVLYYEAGKVNVEFLRGLLPAYLLDEDGKHLSHLKTVHYMRTFLQHNLDPTKEQNRMIQIACENWLHHQCQTRVLTEDRHWKICLISLLREATDFLTAFRDCIHCIEQDECREDILNLWRLRRKRYHPPYEFEKLISLAAADMGRENINAGHLCKRYYERWSRELDLQQGNYDFEVEARKQIEHVLLVETAAVLPITGHDIMEIFNIPSGPQVGELLRCARIIYDAEPCTSDILIEKLRQNKNRRSIEC
jgi:hypothetical protein